MINCLPREKVQVQDREKLLELCDRVSREQDLDTLRALIEELTVLLDEKKERISKLSTKPPES